MSISKIKPSTGHLFRTSVICILGALAVVYSVFAFQYFIGRVTSGPEWWNVFQGWVVSDEYSFGAGSVAQEQAEIYERNKWLLLVHASMGSFCLAIGWTQFISTWRRKYPKVHRTTGKIYLVTVILSMILGLVHLSVIDVAEVFSGAPFGFGLWGLDIIVLLSAVLAYTSIRRRDVRQHQGWMVINYSLICATPVLRVFWLVFGSTTDLSQSTINQSVTTVLLPFTMMLGMIWFSFKHMAPQQDRASANTVSKSLNIATQI